MASRLPQPQRLAAAATYIAILLAVNDYVSGRLFPHAGLSGAWFLSAAAALIVGEFIVEPFFARPADTLANGVAVLIGATTLSTSGAAIAQSTASDGRTAFIAYAGVVIALSMVSIVLKDRAGRLRTVAEVATRVVGIVGRARFVYSAAFFASAYAAYGDSPKDIAVLYLSWVAIFAVAPIEAGLRFAASVRQPKIKNATALVEAIEDPGIVRARLTRGTRASVGAVATTKDGNDGVLVDSSRLLDEARVRIAFPPGTPLRVGAELDIAPREGQGPVVIGHVAAGTTLEELVIDLAGGAGQLGLVEGRLVSVPIGERVVLFQVTEAVVVSETLPAFQYDQVRATARKLGTWDVEKGSFVLVPWIPEPGSPVELLGTVEAPADVADRIGTIPGTSYGIGVDPHALVTHNTAILGILGVGKTHLAWELIERLLIEGIKVVVLDVTGQYAEHFHEILSPETQAEIEKTINDQIAADLDNRTVRGDEAGNVEQFERLLEQLLDDFMAGDERLLILNPNRFEVSKMVGRPFSGAANAMARLSPAEVTQRVAESLLRQVEEEFSTTARLCLVLEEAHSLVPEWNSVAHEGEQAATTGTARAILQGRKYGYGCILVTQRTANVTKSILNQCNTVFGMRIYDATGMGFLENYVGAGHAHLLASLEERHAVIFGRGSACDAPVVIRLNDAAQVRDDLWTPRLPELPVTSGPGTEEGSDGTDDSDVVPF